MKKQILYPKFTPRIFSMAIDLFVLSIILTPVMQVISRYLWTYIFEQFFVNFAIDIYDVPAIAEAMKNSEFASLFFKNMAIYAVVSFVINSIFMASYFIFFWYKFSATPGKMLMKMKVVNVDNHLKPSVYQCCKRFLGYVTIIPGIFSMMLSKTGRATHDKIANTVVIKN